MWHRDQSVHRHAFTHTHMHIQTHHMTSTHQAHYKVKAPIVQESYFITEEAKMKSGVGSLSSPHIQVTCHFSFMVTKHDEASKHSLLSKYIWKLSSKPQLLITTLIWIYHWMQIITQKCDSTSFLRRNPLDWWEIDYQFTKPHARKLLLLGLSSWTLLHFRNDKSGRCTTRNS